MLYDGDCDFCQYCVDYLKKITGTQVKYQTYQTGTLGRPLERCEKAIQLVVSKKEYYQGAAAGFKTMSYGGHHNGWWLYQNLPGFAWLSEKIYLWISHHRNFCHTVAKTILGSPWRVGRIKKIIWSVLLLILVFHIAGQSSQI